MVSTVKKVRLKEHKAAQCYVIFGRDKGKEVIEFISYSTIVIAAIGTEAKGEFNLVCTGAYSATTRKQIGWFLREYFPTLNYYDMKEIAGRVENNKCLSVTADVSSRAYEVLKTCFDRV